MDLTGTQAQYRLATTATPTGTNVTGPVTVGSQLTTAAFSDADIAYSFNVTATAADDSATLTISSGAVAAGAGSPTIADGDGNDFEGVSLPTMVTFHAILVECPTTNTDRVTMASQAAFNIDGAILAGGGAILHTSPEMSGNMTWTIRGSGDSVKVTVIGKSS